MAIGSNSGRKRFTLSARVPGEIASPRSHSHAATALSGRKTGVAFVQEARPHGDPVERVVEQPRRRRRRYLHRRGRALAGPAQARAADHALVGLDLDLDEGRFLDAVRRVGLPAASADARIRRRIVHFGALFKPGPLGAAVAGRAALLAALALRARLVLLLALATEQLPRQHGPSRTQPGKLGFQRLDPALRSLHGLAQPAVLPGQRLDRGLLAPRSAQDFAQLGVHAGQLLRQRLPGGAKPSQAGLPLPPGPPSPPSRPCAAGHSPCADGRSWSSGAATSEAHCAGERPRRTAISTTSPRARGTWQAEPSASPSHALTPPGSGVPGKPPRTAT